MLGFDDGSIDEVSYRETEHFQLTRQFLNDPEQVLRHLLADDDD